MQFHKLRVARTQSEIGGKAKTIWFEVPRHLDTSFTWRPGQHVTLRFRLGGTEVRRSYSISSSPFVGSGMRITVKRVDGGLVSNHINDNVTVGEAIEVMAPFGSFCLDPGETQRRTHYFFAAGSGITPLYSMLSSVLAAEPHSQGHLIYGNTSAASILLKEALAALQQRHPDRLTVAHVLSRPSIWLSLSPWRTGRIDRAAVEAAIEDNPPYAQDTQYYICGPGNMIEVVRSALMGLDVPASRIHVESFGTAVALDESVAGVAANASIVVGEQSHQVPVAAGQTVLQAMRSAGVPASFSCQSGVCGACRATLTSGSAHMRTRMALEDGEIENGAILLCQSLPTSQNISVRID